MARSIRLPPTIFGSGRRWQMLVGPIAPADTAPCNVLEVVRIGDAVGGGPLDRGRSIQIIHFGLSETTTHDDPLSAVADFRRFSNVEADDLFPFS